LLVLVCACLAIFELELGSIILSAGILAENDVACRELKKKLLKQKKTENRKPKKTNRKKNSFLSLDKFIELQK
jgi:hypothetical protein